MEIPMKYYMAPMEGITGYVYRNAYAAHFHDIDTYVAPFIVPQRQREIKQSELRDIFPENNKEIRLIPQLLTNDAEDFICTQKEFAQYGYEELNLNLGCPSGTVTAKGKGSGFLDEPMKLDRFLDKVCSAAAGSISIKTRLGTSDPEEIFDLMTIYNRYPLTKIILHPRIQQEFYMGTPHRDLFFDAAKMSRIPICYNGDVSSRADLKELEQGAPKLEHIMIGRGILRDPWLVQRLKGGEGMPNKAGLLSFHDMIYEGYRQLMSGERNTLFRMKELWSYMGDMFVDSQKYWKKIKKSEKCRDYEAAVQGLFQDLPLKTV